MNRVRFEDVLGNHKRTVKASSVNEAIDTLPGCKLPWDWIALPEDSGVVEIEQFDPSLIAVDTMRFSKRLKLAKEIDEWYAKNKDAEYGSFNTVTAMVSLGYTISKRAQEKG